MPTRKPAASAAAEAEPAAPKPATRAKTTLKLVPNDPAAILSAHVDELGLLEKELLAVRAKLRRAEVLRDLIRASFANAAAGASFEARGAAYGCTLGACAYRSRVDYTAVRKHMGLTAYAAIATPTLKDLEATLAPEVLARVVAFDYTGARPVKTFEITAYNPGHAVPS